LETRSSLKKNMLEVYDALLLSVSILCIVFVFSGCVSWWVSDKYELDRKAFQDNL